MFKTFVTKTKKEDTENTVKKPSRRPRKLLKRNKVSLGMGKRKKKPTGDYRLIEALKELYGKIDSRIFKDIYSRKYSTVIVPSIIKEIGLYTTHLDTLVESQDKNLGVPSWASSRTDTIYIQDWFLNNGNYPKDTQNDMAKYIRSVLAYLDTVVEDNQTVYTEILLQNLLEVGEVLLSLKSR